MPNVNTKNFTLFYVTCDSCETAKTIARSLLDNKLAACANIIPNISSLYLSEGVIKEDNEVVLIIKTVPSLSSKCRDLISELHPYDIPAIIYLDNVNVSDEFSNWINSNLKIPL